MTTLEEMSALAHGDIGIDRDWQWEPPGEPQPRTPNRIRKWTPRDSFVRDVMFLNSCVPGPLVRQYKPGSRHPEFAKTTEPRPAKTGHTAVPQCTEHTKKLQEIALKLIEKPVIQYREPGVHHDPDEFFHFQDDRIATGPTVCGEYVVMRDSVQTDRFYGKVG